MSESSRDPTDRPDGKRPFQFTIKQLLGITTIWAAVCAMAAVMGPAVFVVVLVSFGVVGLMWLEYWKRVPTVKVFGIILVVVYISAALIVVLVNVLMADGSVRRLPEDLPPETLRALLSPNGGEKLDLEVFLK